MEYSESLANKICHRIAQGRTIRSLCVELNVSHTAIYKWLNDEDKKEFAEQYAKARDIQADVLADDILDIADTDEDAARARVRIDARKWHAGKTKPKKYGDSTQIKHADADGNKLSTLSILNAISGRTADLPGRDEQPDE